ncbi:glycosyltransferase [Oleispirillum naphthae]|uniref:glycosyltransferase n=1 Tax=Oleispirillum naphthae TaxID=2838853 RepID=UPI0030822900
MKGRLLALAWAMPPGVFPRALQVSRTLRQLGRQGWDVTVVTVDPRSEASRAADERLAAFYAETYRRIVVDPREETLRSPLWLRAWRKLAPPDDTREDNWLRRAGVAVRRELKAGRYDAFVSFAQPWNDHVVGLGIKRRFPDLPWLAHFSDPWVDSPYAQFADDMRRKAAEKAERAIIAAADAVAFINRHTADLVMRKYPEAWRSKVHLVPHATEPDLLSLLPAPSPRGDAMRVVHTGNFYGRRGPEAVLTAVAELASDPQVRGALRVEFVGNAEERHLRMAGEMGVGEMVAFCGKAGYLESLDRARNADLLLLMDAPAAVNVFLPSKIVDYIMLRRPILGITPAEGASAEALRGLGCAIVAPDDPAAIAAALRAGFARWRAGEEAFPLPDAAAAEAFHIERTTRQFEDTLRQAMDGRRRRR